MLSDEICNFLTGGVSIVLASRNAALQPSVSRAIGCRIIRGERTCIRILVSTAHAGELLDDVRRTGTISATFSLPNTHRALQFKGNNARVENLNAEDRATLEKYLRSFVDVIGPLGFSEEFVRAFFASPADEVAIEFEPSDAFQQTPGPAAGARLA